MKHADFVTTREAAGLLNVSLRTIQLWAENGILSAWKTAGGHRRISTRSVEKIRRDQERAAGPMPTSDKANIVIVEDDPLYLELYQLKIAVWRLPVFVATASNGFEGLMMIGRLSPRIVISDLSMPGMDGFQMIRSLQQNFTDLEVIVITGLSAGEIDQAGGLPETVKLLKKPAPLGELEQFLRRKLEEIGPS